MLYGSVGMYAVVLVMTIIVFIDVAILGPRASQITLENLGKRSFLVKTCFKKIYLSP
jgi:hypothetical protein